MRAQTAEDQGNLAVAARLYRELAQISTSPLRENYQLRAAAALTRGGYLDTAEQLLQPLAQQALTPQQHLQQRTIAARIALHRRDPDQALALLRLPVTLSPEPEHTIALMFALARHVANRIVVLREGRIVEDGPTERVLADPDHEETRALLAAARGLRMRH